MFCKLDPTHAFNVFADIAYCLSIFKLSLIITHRYLYLATTDKCYPLIVKSALGLFLPISLTPTSLTLMLLTPIYLTPIFLTLFSLTLVSLTAISLTYISLKPTSISFLRRSFQ